jgi:hypothetical protein
MIYTGQLIYNNPDFPEVKIKTIGRWIENEKVHVMYINKTGEQKEVERRIYFDTHDLYITINNTRYYYNEFNR